MNSESETSDINLDILDQHNNVIDVSSSTNNSSTDLHLGSLINPEKTKLNFGMDNNDITDVLSSLSESMDADTESESDSDSDSEKESAKDSFKRSASFTSPKAQTERKEDNNKPQSTNFFTSFIGSKKENITEKLDERNMSEGEVRAKKSMFLRKLAEWKKKGIGLLDEVSFSDSFSRIQEVYEETRAHVNRNNGIKISKQMLLSMIAFVETMNHEFDPLDFQLDGWSEHMSLSMDEDESLIEVIEELYDKYNGVGREIPPEVRLLLLITMSGAGYHMSKKKNSSPRKAPKEINIAPPRRNLNDSESDTNNDRIIDANLF